MHRNLRAPAHLTLALVLLLLGGCPPDDEPARNGGAGAGGESPADPSPAPVAGPAVRIVLIEIDELNTDTFPDPLGIVEDVEPQPGFELRDGEVFVDDDLELANSPGAPLAKCRLLVIHRIRYQGRGRSGLVTRHYAFAELPAHVPLPAPPPGGQWSHGPADPGPFAVAVRGIRLFPDSADRIDLDLEGEAVAVRIGNQRQSVAAGAAATFLRTERALAVREESMTAADVEFEGAPPGPPPRIDPTGMDHGQVTFATQVTVSNHGPTPLSGGGPAAQEGL